ncbi:MAG: 3-keto-5-aminohexanoate cleavage protein [Methylophaga sp.]|nr:3-keto-5-aminohexanoate cleavage protein [Methylophaga sp.]
MKTKSDSLYNGLILNLAPTGCVANKITSPNLPMSHNEIVDDVAACMELGVQMVHLHSRDNGGGHCPDREPYGRLIESIRTLPGGRVVTICVTTSGRHDPSFTSRVRVLELDGISVRMEFNLLMSRDKNVPSSNLDMVKQIRTNCEESGRSFRRKSQLSQQLALQILD